MENQLEIEKNTLDIVSQQYKRKAFLEEQFWYW